MIKGFIQTPEDIAPEGIVLQQLPQRVQHIGPFVVHIPGSLLIYSIRADYRTIVSDIVPGANNVC